MGRAKKKRQANNKQPVPEVSKSNDGVQKVMMYTGVSVIAVIVALVVVNSFRVIPPPEFNLESQPSIGSENAPVKVVEFGDFKCPACRDFHQVVYPQLTDEYINNDLVEFYFINYPIPSATGLDTTNASVLAECMYQESESHFWRYYDAVYENQGTEAELWATPEHLVSLSKEFVDSELDEEAMLACISEGTQLAVVNEDQQLGRNAGVVSTPSVFVNGRLVRAASFQNLQVEIDAALEAIENE